MWKGRADSGVRARPQGPGIHLQALARGRKPSFCQMSLAHEAGPAAPDVVGLVYPLPIFCLQLGLYLCVVHEPAAAVLPRSVLKMQRLGPHLRPTESETLWVGPMILCFKRASRGFDRC